MTTKLQLWNKALLHLGEGRLLTLTDDVEARYVFDEYSSDVLLDGLSRGDWNFATKTTILVQSTTTTVIAGYTFAYDHPTDWVRTIAMSILADFEVDLLYGFGSLDVYDERGSWFTNSESLFTRYISNDFVSDASVLLYPPSYVEFVAALLAYRTVERLTQGRTSKEDLSKLLKKKLLKAKSNDARNMKEAIIRPGLWSRSLRGGVSRRRNLGVIVGGGIVLQEEDI